MIWFTQFISAYFNNIIIPSQIISSKNHATSCSDRLILEKTELTKLHWIILINQLSPQHHRIESNSSQNWFSANGLWLELLSIRWCWVLSWLTKMIQCSFVSSVFSSISLSEHEVAWFLLLIIWEGIMILLKISIQIY